MRRVETLNQLYNAAVRLSALLLLSALALRAQVPPQHGFCAAFIAALPQSRPEPTGGYVCATPVSNANEVWMLAGNTYVLVQHQLEPVSVAGPATLLRQFTFGSLYGYGALGGSTSTTATKLAIQGGAVLRGQFGHSAWSWLAGLAQIKAASGVTTQLHIGIGATW